MKKKASDSMTFGERLAYARKKKGLQQIQLAELIGVRPEKIRHLEKDKRDPDVSMIRKIIKALEVSEDWLIGNDDNFNMKSIAENQKNFKLTKEQQQLVADNERAIGAAFKRFVRKYLPTWESYDEFYGDAAIKLCWAAKVFDERGGNKDRFFWYGFVSVQNAMIDSYMKKEDYSHHTTSLNKTIDSEYGDNLELGSAILAPDEWESLEYKILVDSLFQKVEHVLTAKEKEVLKPWLSGKNWYAIADECGITEGGVEYRIEMIRKKCRKYFNSNELFACGGQY